MDFSNRTYLVLEIKNEASWVKQILNFREKHEPWRRQLPFEVTIIGSSGVGVFSKEQNYDEAIYQIDCFAKKSKPISLKFSRRSSFPDSNLYFFELFNRVELQGLQNAILGLGLNFTKSLYPFTPHCTIADLGDAPSIEALKDLEMINVPTEEVRVDAISFYQLRDSSSYLLHRSFFESD